MFIFIGSNVADVILSVYSVYSVGFEKTQSINLGQNNLENIFYFIFNL